MEKIEREKTTNPIRTIIYLGIVLGVIIPMVPQLVWAFSHRWLFPSIIPSEWSMRAWEYIANPNTKVLSSTLNSLFIALSVTAVSILVEMNCPMTPPLAGSSLVGGGAGELLCVLSSR